MNCNIEKREEYCKKGLLIKAESPDKQLVQYNYNESCMFDGAWDEITLNSRGHIYEQATGELICPAMAKFFNFSQLKEEEQTKVAKLKKYTLTQKMDGCLGFIYKYKGEQRYNSRGSFNSFVTDAIKRIIKEQGLEDKLDKILDKYCLIVEVISPETKILVNYGNESNLYLITVFNAETKKEENAEIIKTVAKELSIPVVKDIQMTFDQLKEWQKTHDWTEEGFVLKYIENGEIKRVKFKSEDYLRVAAVKAYLDRVHIINYCIKQGENWEKNLIDMIKTLPDELYKEGIELVNEIVDEYKNIEKEINSAIEKTKGMTDKEIGLSTDKEIMKYKPVIFARKKNKKGKKSDWIFKKIKK